MTRRPNALLSVSLVFAALSVVCANDATVTVDETHQFQTFLGCGASLTDSSAWLLSDSRGSGDKTPTLTPSQRSALMQTLFNATHGIGLSILRQPMGTSDFRWYDYTFDPLPSGVGNDSSLKYFTVYRDQYYIIPMILAALDANPAIRVIGLPWSPPDWMKESSSVYGGAVRGAALPSLSQYFVDFVSAYEKAGVPVWAVSLQNEPLNSNPTYPTALMSANQQITLAKLVAAGLRASSLDTVVIVYDHNWDNIQYPDEVLSGTSADEVAGAAFHCYAGDPSAMAKVAAAHPDRLILQTECTEHGTANFFYDMSWAIKTLVIRGTAAGASSVLEFNAVLNADYGPKRFGGCSNCRGLLTITWDGSDTPWAPQPAFYALAHLSKFVPPGSVRIQAELSSGSSSDVSVVGFKTAAGAVVLVCHNDNTGATRSVDVAWGGKHVTVPIPPKSAVTARWSLAASGGDASVQWWLTTGDEKHLLARQPDLTWAEVKPTNKQQLI